MNRAYLFVYGTLMANSTHPVANLLRQHARLTARGSIQARLYVVNDPDQSGTNSYPGAIPSPDPNARVYGELYAILEPDLIYPDFDAYEGCSDAWPEPHEFLLRPVTVSMANGKSKTAVAYLYTWDVNQALYIPEGRYRGQTLPQN